MEKFLVAFDWLLSNGSRGHEQHEFYSYSDALLEFNNLKLFIESDKEFIDLVTERGCSVIHCQKETDNVITFSAYESGNTVMNSQILSLTKMEVEL